MQILWFLGIILNQSLPEPKTLARLVRRVAVNLSKTRGALAVALRGSIVSGHVTATSDVDLIVLKRGGPRRIEVTEIEGVPFHIRYFALSYVRLMLAERNPRMIEFLVNSRPLIDKSNAYRSVMRDLGRFPNEDFISDLVTIGGHFINDAQGQIVQGDYDSAIFLARAASVSLANAFVLQKGKIAFKERHVAKALRERKEFSEINKLFEKVQGFDKTGRGKAKQVLYDAIRMHDKITGRASQ